MNPPQPDDPRAEPRDAVVPAATMRHHLAAGAAQALLPGHFPVPVKYQGWWWEVPQGQADFIRAGHASAVTYERHARAYLAATRGQIGPPT
jgi:hypothetical protein